MLKKLLNVSIIAVIAVALVCGVVPAANSTDVYASSDDATATVSAATYYYTVNPTTTLYTNKTKKTGKIEVKYMTKLKFIKNVSKSRKGVWKKFYYKSKYRYGWVAAGKTVFTKKRSSFNYTNANNTPYQQAVVDRAMYIYKNWPTKYAYRSKYGVKGSDGKYAFVCSGYASYVLNSVMQKECPLYDVSADLNQFYKTSYIINKGVPGSVCAKNICTKVDYSKIKPGDILFFNVSEAGPTKGVAYNHCGIYLGNKEFIHCTKKWNRVCIMPLKGNFYKGFVKAKRFIPATPITPANKDYAPKAITKFYKSANTTSTVLHEVRPENGLTYTLLFSGPNEGVKEWGYFKASDGTYGYLYNWSASMAASAQ